MGNGLMGWIDMKKTVTPDIAKWSNGHEASVLRI